MAKFFKKNGAGFTLAELLIVTAIIGILAAIIFPNYRSAQRQLALQRAAGKLTQDIRTAQEMATSAEEYAGCLGTTGYKYGYGIYFDSSVLSSRKYILFADCDGEGTYNDSVDLRVGQEIELEQGVRISSPVNPLYIIFTPPDPTVSISGAPSAAITLTNDEKDKTITVNAVGLVNIVD